MAIPTWATAADLEEAMGEDAFREIYDEDSDGVADASKVALDLKRAHAQVVVRIRPAYSGGLPASDDDGFLQLAVLEYAQGFAHDRHPEYRRFKTEFFTRGNKLCEDLRAGKASPAPETPEPVPVMGSSSASDADIALPTFVRERGGRGCCR